LTGKGNVVGYEISFIGEDDPSNGSGTNHSFRPPPRGKGLFVENQGRHRMAYRDADGAWSDYYTGEVLQGEVIYRDHK
jgi:hypothetical protein